MSATITMFSRYGADHPDTFTLTADHLTLLRHSWVMASLSDVETGAAEIDGKRPYGNSDVVGDVVELLGWDAGVLDEDRDDYDEDEAEHLSAKAMRLHEQTPTALQIVLSVGAFEPGDYRHPDRYNTQKWVRA